MDLRIAKILYLCNTLHFLEIKPITSFSRLLKQSFRGFLRHNCSQNLKYFLENKIFNVVFLIKVARLHPSTVSKKSSVAVPREYFIEF